MVRLLLACLALGLVAGHHEYDQHNDCDDNDDIAGFSADIKNVAADLFDYEDTINTKVKRVDQAEEIVREFSTRIEQLAGSGCDDRWEFQCGGNKPTCVSRLLVCDTVTDCPNAAEESQCRVFAPAGSEWHAEMSWDHCTSRRPKKFHIHIDEYKVIDYLRSFPEIKATMEMDQEHDDFSYAAAFPIHGWMDLKPGSHIMFFEPPESDGLALTCTFDGVNDDHCKGTIIHQSSMNVCAEFHMRRV